MNLSLKEIVKDNKVYFSHYRANYLYYNITVNDIKYIFPVPLTTTSDDGEEVNEVGDATLLNEDKAMIFMRYIRKAIDNKTFSKTK